MTIVIRTPEEITDARWMVRSVSFLHGHDSYCEQDTSGFQPYDPERFGDARAREILTNLAWNSAEFRQPRTAVLEVYANGEGFDIHGENAGLLINKRHSIKKFAYYANKYMVWDNARDTLREAMRVGDASAKSGVMRVRDALKAELDGLQAQVKTALDRFLAETDPDAVFRDLFPLDFKVVKHWSADAASDAIEITKPAKETRSFYVTLRTKNGEAISVSEYKINLFRQEILTGFGWVPAGMNDRDFRNSFYYGAANARNFIREMDRA